MSSTMMCSRCGQGVAIVFVTKIENGKSASNEGLCLKCAREIGIKPMNDIMRHLGISEEEVDAMTEEIMDAIGSPEDLKGLLGIDDNDDDDDSLDEEGKTATFPFLNRFFGGITQSPADIPAIFPPPPPGGDGGQRNNPRDNARENSQNSRDKKAKGKKFLENYCLCLTARAKEGKLDRVIGREDEIERVIQILNRRQKNNPCLIGEPGVGKTAIAEGLAIAITDGTVPFKLREKEVYLLDLTSLVAGTQFRGQFESRMKGLIDEIKRLGNIILVIDEVHSLVGAGDAEGSMNAANILKPALSRGEVQVVGATTLNEYRKHIEKDAALERRFQPVVVTEPSVADSIEIIKGVAPYYEEFHGVKIPDDVARQAVLLSERYITDRFLPDKAIDLIDEACSDLNLKTPAIYEGEALRKALETISAERESLMNIATNDAYEKLAELKSREINIEEKLKTYTDTISPSLSVENLARVIEQWTKIPASKIREIEYIRLSELESRLKSRIVGQDKAVESVAAAIRRGRAGVSAKHKPISFIFTGPTGVGKTELVKTLASDLFDETEALIRLDMSEFMEKHAVSRIIGAPPGYVGYDEAGQLTEKVRRKPYCVILFDEIEKAHPDVLNILLQILDDGHITDAHGRKVNFENSVIIMTSNAGSDKTSTPIGYAGGVSDQSREKAIKALSDFLRPEFINRIDEIVSFSHLGEEEFAKIASLLLKELCASLSERNLNFAWEDDVAKKLAEKSYSKKFGARNLRRTIQKEIEDPVANIIIDSGKNASEGIGAITHLKASVKDEEIKVVGL